MVPIFSFLSNNNVFLFWLENYQLTSILFSLLCLWGSWEMMHDFLDFLCFILPHTLNQIVIIRAQAVILDQEGIWEWTPYIRDGGAKR